MSHRLLTGGDSPLARATIIWTGLFTVVLCWFSPSSLSSRLITAGGDSGKIVLSIFTVVVLIGAIDWIINDILPSAYVSRCLLQSRHVGYTLLAAAYLIQAYAAAKPSKELGELILALGYSSQAVLAAWAALSMAYTKRAARCA